LLKTAPSFVLQAPGKCHEFPSRQNKKSASLNYVLQVTENIHLGVDARASIDGVAPEYRRLFWLPGEIMPA
jgi:hypothetical protein